MIIYPRAPPVVVGPVNRLCGLISCVCYTMTWFMSSVSTRSILIFPGIIVVYIMPNACFMCSMSKHNA